MWMNSERVLERNNMAEAHNCLRALQAYIGFQQTRISNLENDFRNVKTSWAKKEKLLVEQLTTLSKQLQFQGNTCNPPQKNKYDTITDDPNVLLISVALNRVNGSLGFTLNGGGDEHIECGGALSVSKIVSGGAADGKLQPEDNIIKVNGQDLSKVSHEEAVEAFRVAQEPIVVEVLRRASKDTSPPPPSAMSPPSPCSSSGGKSSTCPSLADASTQTEWVEGWDELLRPTTPPPELYSLNNGGTEELDDVTPPDPEDSFDDLRHFDFEYEEVTLERTSSDERLGLTLCYGSGEDVETAIFISEIDPQGVAAVDGRIREGDQLLQVNGVDVRTRNEAISMLSSNDKARVTLLLARAQLQDFEVELVDPVTGLQVHHEEDEMGISDDDEGTGRKMAEGPPTTDSEGSLDKEVALLSEEMTSLQLPDDGNEERWTDDRHETIRGADQEKDSSSAYNTGGESCRSTPLEILTIQPPPPPNPQLNSSSTQSSQTRNIHATADAETQLTVDSDAYSVLSCESCRKCLRLPPPPPIRTNGSKMAEKASGGSSSSRKRVTRDGSVSDLEKNRNYVTLIPRETVYTTEAHLAHTMWLQQEMLRHSLQRQMRATSGHVNVNNGCSPHRQRSSTSNEEMEWKVKKRPDGTRYIARRPVRNKLLKERESKLLQERTLTTDDETVSEVKFGRYWSKEERKRHLERARDQKRKREMILRMRKGSDIIPEDATMAKVTPPHILELSQRKMARKKGKSLFDDFTTVQEVLAHGTRGAGPSKALGLLSVTTV